MADIRKSPSKIPRLKVPGKRPNNEARSSPLKPVYKISVNPLAKDMKTLPKPSLIQKGKKSPMLATKEFKVSQAKSAPKAILQDRRGISEIRRSEKNLRTAMAVKEQELSLLRENLQSLEDAMKQRDQKIYSLSEGIVSIQERLETTEKENAMQAEKLQELNICSVTGSQLLCTNYHDRSLDHVRKTRLSSKTLLDTIMKIDVSEI